MTAAAPTKKRVRDPWPDNARLIAALLIVMMHFADPVMNRSTSLPLLFAATWPMRVPLYVLIAGYFSSAEPFTRRRAVALVRNVLLVYLTFEILATIQKWLLGGSFSFNPTRPSLALWFLLSLFIWRATLPLVSKIRWIIPISFGVAVVAGFASSIDGTMSMSRTLVFGPIFLIGWKIGQRGLRETLIRPWVTPTAVALFVAWIAAAVLLLDQYRGNLGIFMMKNPYRPDHYLLDASVRMLLIVCGTALALSMLALTPKITIKGLTYLGTGSLYIYLLHPFFVRQINAWGWYDAVHSKFAVVVLLAGSIALGLCLGTKPVRWLFRRIIQPRYEWLFVPETSPGETTSTTQAATARTDASHRTISMGAAPAASVSTTDFETVTEAEILTSGSYRPDFPLDEKEPQRAVVGD